jgi:hypothetical protein
LELGGAVAELEVFAVADDGYHGVQQEREAEEFLQCH